MRAEDKIFQAFFDARQSKLYYSQLKEQTRLSHSSLQNALEKLSKAQTVRQEKTKSNLFYKICDKEIFVIRFSEIAIKKFRNLNLEVKIPLENFLENLPKDIFTIVLFGSASKKEETKDSDIDLLIVTNTKRDFKDNKKNAEITSKHPISIFQCSVHEFIDNKDDVIFQARKTGFPVYKEQNFYEVMLDEY